MIYTRTEENTSNGHTTGKTTQFNSLDANETNLIT